MSKTSKKQPNTKEDYEAIGKSLVEFYETGYFDKKAVLKQTFLKGIVAGLGGVIGATIVVALLIWALSFFKEIPLIGPFTNSIRSTIETKQ